MEKTINRLDAIREVRSIVLTKGLYFVLLNMSYYQNNEEYEFCEVIKDGINSLEKYNFDFDTRVDRDSLDMLLNDIYDKDIKNVALFENNMPYYIECCNKSLEIIKDRLYSDGFKRFPKVVKSGSLKYCSHNYHWHRPMCSEQCDFCKKEDSIN